MIEFKITDVISSFTISPNEEGFEWLQEPTTVYVVEYEAYKTKGIKLIWVKESNDRGQIEVGYTFQG